MSQSKIEKRSESACWSAGVFLLVMCLVLGGLAGVVFKAANDTVGFAEVTSWTTITDVGGTFNWGIFILFGLAGILCFALGVIGQAITEAIRTAARKSILDE